MTPPAAAPAVRPRPGVAPRRRPSAAPPPPRRVSGPARQGRPQVRARPAGTERGLVHALPAAVGRVAEHPLVDRLIAGKAWIGVVAFALIGIVTLQLLLLGLNRSIGRDLAREGVLQEQNSALSIENAELAIGERVQAQAGTLGMTLIPAGSLRFLSARHGAVSKALAALAAPVSQSSTGAGESTESPAGASSTTSTTTTSSSSSSASTSTSGSNGETPAEGGGEAAGKSSSAESTGTAETQAGSGERTESHSGATGEPTAAGATAEGGTPATPGG